MYNPIFAQQIANLQMAALQQYNNQQQMHPSFELQLAKAESDDDDDDEDEQKRTIFCANLDERVTEEILYEAFLQAGPIESVRIPKDNSGRQRTFGFVTFVHQCSAPYAIKLLQGLAFFRKTLTIKYQHNTNASMPNRRTVPNDLQGLSNSRSGVSYTSMSSGSNYQPINNELTNNPFKKEIPEWTLDSGGSKSNADNERISKHASSQLRSHTNSLPYRRHSNSQDRRSEQQQNDFQRRHQQQSSNNRRSEQRSGRRR